MNAEAVVMCASCFTKDRVTDTLLGKSIHASNLQKADSPVAKCLIAQMALSRQCCMQCSELTHAQLLDSCSVLHAPLQHHTLATSVQRSRAPMYDTLAMPRFRQR